jgi:hypothetical protein
MGLSGLTITDVFGAADGDEDAAQAVEVAVEMKAAPKAEPKPKPKPKNPNAVARDSANEPPDTAGYEASDVPKAPDVPDVPDKPAETVKTVETAETVEETAPVETVAPSTPATSVGVRSDAGTERRRAALRKIASRAPSFTKTPTEEDINRLVSLEKDLEDQRLALSRGREGRTPVEEEALRRSIRDTEGDIQMLSLRFKDQPLVGPSMQQSTGGVFRSPRQPTGNTLTPQQSLRRTRVDPDTGEETEAGVLPQLRAKEAELSRLRAQYTGMAQDAMAARSADSFVTDAKADRLKRAAMDPETYFGDRSRGVRTDPAYDEERVMGDVYRDFKQVAATVDALREMRDTLRAQVPSGGE